MNRLEQLTAEVTAIYTAHKTEISQLDRRGPNGGRNARFIKGWTRSPHQTITRAVNLAGKVSLNLWDGSAPTPSTAIPSCVVDSCWLSYRIIYQYGSVFVKVTGDDGIFYDKVLSKNSTEHMTLLQSEGYFTDLICDSDLPACVYRDFTNGLNSYTEQSYHGGKQFYF